MRRHDASLPLPAADDRRPRAGDALRSLLPYLWVYRVRVLLALACLVLAKSANIGVPLIFKALIDALTASTGNAVATLVAVPALLIAAYGLLRFGNAAFTELREIVFAKVTQRAVRAISLQVFRHLHALSLRFHLERQTGGLTRDIERGTRAIGSLINYTLYSIVPIVIEFALVIGILLARYEARFALVTTATVAGYIVFTVVVTNWRTHFRREANELDARANTRAVDSLLNYETVKYFNNEDYEAQRYDEQLRRWAAAQTRSQTSLSFLNIGQAGIIAVGVTAMMWEATAGVIAGKMSLGDIVLMNVFLIQLYQPLNFLGVLYREIRQAITDIERLFNLLEQEQEIADAPDARELAPGPATVAFDHVGFSYDGLRPILIDVDFTIPAGRTVAVVGHSGAGKSTLSRLLYRFYDVRSGAVRINGDDVRTLTQRSVRAAIGIVPQDTVLFNDTIRYNILYGRPGASEDAMLAAAQAAQLHDFVAQLPEGYETRVGERGLKLSGGEKQRVAIARALLKDPPILIFDEATSALDSKTEKAIQAQIELAARGRTTLVIAHRLSTVMNADEILVLDAGRVVERGRHPTLLAGAGPYAQMWQLQQQEEQAQLALATAV
ncbi:MAG: ABC transporter ATP-binding protein/permease [Rhodocyclaceae bacterium]|nr:ABC transporter ATP-binding protein/permease [Rhodocyclaceae bacterium]